MQTPMTYALIATETFSILISIILLYANWRGVKNKSARSRLYSALALINVLALLSDAMAYQLDGVPGWNVLRLITNLFSIILSNIMVGVYAGYIHAYISESRQVSKIPFYLFYLYSLGATIITTILCLTGHIFEVEGLIANDGSLYDFYVIMCVLSMFFCVVILIVYRKALRTGDRIAAYIYIAFPLINAVLGLFIEEWDFTYPATTLSMMVLYIVIQSEQNSKLEHKNQVSLYYAYHDEMTGLLSRRAYTDKLDELSEKEGNIGVIFADVNGLKYENDHFGHKAGDRLITSMAEALCKHYRKEEVYRISGDEFVVLLPDVDRERFDRRYSDLRSSMSVGGRTIASVGCEYGSCSKVNELVQMAETNMYRQKEEYHRTHSQMDR